MHSDVNTQRRSYGQYFTLWDRVCNSYEPAEKTNTFAGDRLATSYSEVLLLLIVYGDVLSLTLPLQAKRKHQSLGKNEAEEFEKDEKKKA